MKSIPIIPMSSWKGCNITQQSKDKSFGWWKGFKVKIKKETLSGYTVYDALEKTVRVKRNENASFKMIISDVKRPKDKKGVIVIGRVEQGTIKPGDNVSFAPTPLNGRCASIERFHEDMKQATAGDICAIKVLGIMSNDKPRKGYVMFSTDDKTFKPPKAVTEFTAKVFVLGHPNPLKPARFDNKP
eukprot:UN04700